MRKIDIMRDVAGQIGDPIRIAAIAPIAMGVTIQTAQIDGPQRGDDIKVACQFLFPSLFRAVFSHASQLRCGGHKRSEDQIAFADHDKVTCIDRGNFRVTQDHPSRPEC